MFSYGNKYLCLLPKCPSSISSVITSVVSGEEEGICEDRSANPVVGTVGGRVFTHRCSFVMEQVGNNTKFVEDTEDVASRCVYVWCVYVHVCSGECMCAVLSPTVTEHLPSTVPILCIQ